jgi:hypothetical protein
MYSTTISMNKQELTAAHCWHYHASEQRQLPAKTDVNNKKLL